MPFRHIALPALAALGLALLLGACTTHTAGIDSGAVLQGGYGTRTTYQGDTSAPLEGRVQSTGVIADGNGGIITTPGVPFGQQNPNHTDARELKLKVRELAEQLVADMRDCSLQGVVALPTDFVDLNNFERTSAFGRLVGEQLFHELNQRGYPVREYRMAGSVKVRKEGEFILSRALSNKSTGGSVVIVGTYSATPDSVFVNARLVRPNGRVLRTANLVLENNPTLNRMLRASSGGGARSTLALGKSGEGSGMRIRDFDNAVRPAPPQNLTPFDQGQDIH